MRAAILWLIGLATMVNGGVTLLVPAFWYGLVPGAAGTGPLNPHFARDVGDAYLVAGGGLLWFVRQGARAAAMMATAFLLMHALTRVVDAIAGRETLDQLLVDAPAVLLPGALMLVLLQEKAS